MNPEEKKDDSNEFGKVIDALHNKAKLPSLRSYQGDMAEFIKEKNESVISIAVKEKERKEEMPKKEEKFKLPSQKKTGNFQKNFAVFLLSLLLIVGGSFGLFYVYKFIKNRPLPEAPAKEYVIPYNNLLTLANISSQNFGLEFKNLPFVNGLSLVEVSDGNSVPFQKSKDFFSFLKVSLPPALERTLKDQYAIGSFSQNEENSYFIILTIKDFGVAFAAMLEWEKSLTEDLNFLISSGGNSQISSTTDSLIPDFFEWKDLLIKNKDIRALANEKNRSIIAYTFLDKNTILITNNVLSVDQISSVYVSRSIAR